MRLPRFSLRTLFVLVALLSIPLGWVAYQLNWIRQRHQFLETKVRTRFGVDLVEDKHLPWPLRLFGETSQSSLYLVINQKDMGDAETLFPEARFAQVPD